MDISDHEDPNYVDWQRRLETAFFSDPDGLVVMFVDDDVLARIAPDFPDASLDLAAAVMANSGQRRSADLFPHLSALHDTWASTGRVGLPPTLPLLALSVLAASRMRRDQNVAANNYYLRLAELIHEVQPEHGIEETRVALSSSFRSVARMWISLDRLLDETKSFGASTIRDHPKYTLIGYPLSQALIRGADRAHLTRFFSRLDLEHDGVPAEAALLKYLKIWAERPRGLSPAFTNAIGNAELSALIGPLIHRLAETWDGRVATVEGKWELPLRIALDLEEFRTHWIVDLTPGLDGEVLTGATSAGSVSVTIDTSHGLSYYSFDDDLPLAGRDCTRGLELSGTRALARFRGTEVLLFSKSPATGTWLSCDAIVPFEEHVLAATGQSVEAVRALLADAGDTGWRPLAQQRGGAALLDGYTVFIRATFSDEDTLERALRGSIGLKAPTLRPEPTTRPRFSNGLPIARNLSRNHYLVGGAPDLLIPASETAQTVTANLDGAESRLRARGFPVPLRGLSDLGPGQHRVEVDGDALRFTLLDGDPDAAAPSGTGSLAWSLSAQLGAAEEASLACGGIIARVDILEPLLARRGQDTTLVVHTDGTIQRVDEPAAPAFLGAESHIATSQYFEVSAGNAVAWLLQCRKGRWTIRTVSNERPSFERRNLSGEVTKLWDSLEAIDAGDDPRWQQYLRAAGVAT
ncbi:hypothetical protein [Cellulomonas sp. Root137]|uniref:hypothetical protein n=1 Tax=Cellulomonas sp. Root137 TaxID=1736459 RepID=UPI0006FB932D|nr:hypothetical protein [Cellulomonas sp. Root137]KQY41880.1 hypothetical protein ASD18_19795 [Cellulomonas sp. Root137]